MARPTGSTELIEARHIQALSILCKDYHLIAVRRVTGSAASSLALSWPALTKLALPSASCATASNNRIFPTLSARCFITYGTVSK
jgi:hypothetical protein